MIAFSRYSLGLVFLAGALAFSIPGYAQSQSEMPQQAPMMNNGNGGVGMDDMHNGFERQDIREEREQIRKEHEDLEAARDKLHEQCANAQGAQAQSCEQQRDALRAEHEKLHERVHALHDKMEQLRQAGGDQPANNHLQPPTPINSSAPPVGR